ncbi:t-SNARE affecting a late Golgi compartment protein 2, partial [Candida tropicalis]
MESMVIEQGTMLDRIDYNLTTTVQELKSADKELIKAHHYQKRTTKCKIIFFLSLCVFALLMIVMLRPGGSTKKIVVEKPVPAPVTDPDRPTIDKPENDITDPNDVSDPNDD